MNRRELRLPKAVLMLAGASLTIGAIVTAALLPSGNHARATHVASEFLAGAGGEGKLCADLQGAGQTWTEFTLFGGDNLANGNHTDGTLEVTVSNLTLDSFDWTSNIGVDAVVVKGGIEGSNLYRYDPPTESTGDDGLGLPPGTNEIAHISFCYDTGATPTPTPTPAPTPVVLPPQEFLRTYSAKFLCGTFASNTEGPVKPGNYATAINVHNLQDSPVEFTKKAVVSAREDEPRSPPTSPITLALNPDEALEIDCPDIRQLLGLPLGEEFVKGFVIIRSDSVEIDVVAVYTARLLDKDIQCLTKNGELEPPDEGACPKGSIAVAIGQGGGLTIDVEYIEAKPGPASGAGGAGFNESATLAGTSFVAAFLAVGLTVGAFRVLRGRSSGHRGTSGREEE